MLLTFNNKQSLDILQCSLTKYDASAQPIVEPNLSYVIFQCFILFQIFKDKPKWRDPCIRYTMTARRSICLALLGLHRKSPSGETCTSLLHHMIYCQIYQGWYPWADGVWHSLMALNATEWFKKRGIRVQTGHFFFFSF